MHRNALIRFPASVHRVPQAWDSASTASRSPMERSNSQEQDA